MHNLAYRPDLISTHSKHRVDFGGDTLHPHRSLRMLLGYRHHGNTITFVGHTRCSKPSCERLYTSSSAVNMDGNASS